MARSRQPPNAQIEFLVDRSLGRYKVPSEIRKLGFVVHTLASVYGEGRAQRVSDAAWLKRAGRQGWVVLTKDDAIRRRPAEMQAFVAAGVRVFCLTTASLRAEEQAGRFVDNINRIVQRARKPGPYIYGVYAKEVRLIWPS